MFSHRWEFAVEWGDCDAAGIVFYPQYFRFFDAGASRLIAAALGMRMQAWTARYGVIGIPLVDARANFKRPSRFEDRLTLVSTVSELSRSSITLAHEVFRPDGALGLEGTEKRVWAARNPNDPDSIVAAAIPDEVRAKLTV